MLDEHIMQEGRKQLAFEIDERLASLRFVDQPGQWVNTTPPDVKKRQEKAWEKLAKMMEEKSKTCNGRILFFLTNG